MTSRLSNLISIPATALLMVAGLATPPAAAAPPPEGGSQSDTDHRATIHIPLFLESGGYRSVLTLNNNRPEPIQVEVEIHGPGGERIEPVPVEIPALTTIEWPLAPMLAGTVPYGSLEIRYEGAPLEATAQVTVSSAARRVSFESPETHPALSRRLDAILRLPGGNAQATLALTNLSDGPLSATIEAMDQSSRLVRLKARQTRLVDATALVGKGREGEGAALLRVVHDGPVGGLAAIGFVVDERTGFSSTLAFSDPAAARSSRLAAADFRFGAPEAGEGFPPGASFLATLTLANRGNSPLDAKVFVNFTKEGFKSRVEAAELALDPSEVLSVGLNEALAGAGIAGPVQEAGLDIVHDGAPGALLAKLGSRDATGDFSHDYPVKDPEEAEHTGGSYPWRLDGGRRTVVHFKNTTGQAERVLPQIRWPGGSYTPEALTLGPWESVALDLERLRASGEPDVAGATLPTWADSGQLVWYAESHGAVVGRAEVRDDAAGVASGFSCEPICCGVVRDNVYMDPGAVADVVGNEGDPFTPRETRRDCYGNLFGPYDMTSQSDWESSDTSVATVSGGHVTCVSGGTAGITATFDSITAFASYPSMCYAIVVPGTAGGSMTVNEPTLQGPSSVTRGGSATFTIQNTNASTQISGWKFSSSLGTVNRTSGTSSTSWSGEMAAGGTVSVTVVQGGNSYPLSKSVAVNPRSGFAFNAVNPQKAANGSRPALTVQDPPPTSGSKIGANCLDQTEGYNYRQIGGGPNDSFKYLTSASDLTDYLWVISPSADNPDSPFYKAQCGNYDAQTGTGYISGAQLQTNTIHHESANFVNSHYYNYRIAQDDPQKNVGIAMETFVRGPSTDLNTFMDNLSDFLASKRQVILDAKDVEPCGGFVNRNHSGNCEMLGSINFPPYQVCQ